MEQRARTGGDGTESGEKGCRVGLLKTGFQEVGRLKDESREYASGETGKEVKCLGWWSALPVSVRVNGCSSLT